MIFTDVSQNGLDEMSEALQDGREVWFTVETRFDFRLGVYPYPNHNPWNVSAAILLVEFCVGVVQTARYCSQTVLNSF